MNIFKEILSDSGKGTLSSKRVMGAITFVVCLGCIVYLTITAGATTIVENLLQTAMLMAAALLGLSSVTDIWSNKLSSPQDNQPSKNNHNNHGNYIDNDYYIDNNYNCNNNDYIDDSMHNEDNYIDEEVYIEEKPKSKRKKSKK